MLFFINVIEIETPSVRMAGSVSRDLDFAVAVLKCENKDGEVKYEARCSSCTKTKQHPVDFIHDDMQRLSELLPKNTEENVNEEEISKITLYLQYAPCPKYFEMLKAVHKRIDELRIKFYVKFANLTDYTEQENGIEMLLRESIVVEIMNEEDWNYWMEMVDDPKKDPRERHISEDVLESIHKRFQEEIASSSTQN